MQLVSAGLGEDLNAAKAGAIVLSGKGVLVDADFADGGLRRKLAAGEAVDVNLTAVGAGSGAGESGKLRGKLVRIIRERVKILAFEDGGAGIRILVDGDSVLVSRYVNDGGLVGDGQLGIDGLGNFADAHTLADKACEAGHGNGERVHAGGYATQAIGAVRARLHNVGLAGRTRQGDGRTRDLSVIRVDDVPAERHRAGACGGLQGSLRSGQRGACLRAGLLGVQRRSEQRRSSESQRGKTRLAPAKSCLANKHSNSSQMKVVQECSG